MNGLEVPTSTYTFELKNNVLILNKTNFPRPNATAVADVSGATLDQTNNAIFGWDKEHTRVGVTTELGLEGVITDNPILLSGGFLSSQSLLIGAGIFASSLLDNSGTTFQSPPSIGAYEYVRPRTMTTTRELRS